MKTWLVDTGPLVAYFDADDPQHERVAHAIGSGGFAFWTTMPVVTEAMHLLADVRGGAAALVEFLRRTHTRIHPASELEELQRIVLWLAKYADVPMDFADGSLVLLAEKLNVRDILTLDERGFRAFRFQRRQSVHLVLDDFPG